MEADPQQGEIWRTAKGRFVEILSRTVVENSWHEKVDIVAYRFLGASQVWLVTADDLDGWTKENV